MQSPFRVSRKISGSWTSKGWRSKSKSSKYVANRFGFICESERRSAMVTHRALGAFTMKATMAIQAIGRQWNMPATFIDGRRDVGGLPKERLRPRFAMYRK